MALVASKPEQVTSTISMKIGRLRLIARARMMFVTCALIFCCARRTQAGCRVTFVGCAAIQETHWLCLCEMLYRVSCRLLQCI